MDISDTLLKAVDAIQNWEKTWGPFDRHPSQSVDEKLWEKAFGDYTERLKGNYPFFHPRYAGQMLKPPHPAAISAYLAAMLINPNNHALDGGPPTGEMEKEVVRMLADLFGFPEAHLGHLTSSGTLANLEALWVARELDATLAVAFSEEAHYTHGRMSRVLGLQTRVIPSDHAGRMRLDALEEVLKTGEVGTVVLTTGTTGLGAVDPVADVLPLCRRYGARIHVDAAYGGFFMLLAGAENQKDTLLSAEVCRHFQAIQAVDSIAIDPHKHGLQPYGCGAVLFRDPTVGRFYVHDSPYTYFTSDALHLGEISLECSRAGAAAGALWLTLQVLPLSFDKGLGPILSAGLQAAQTWHGLIDESDTLHAYIQPELDILTFFPNTLSLSSSSTERASQALFERAMADMEDPIFLSVLRVESASMQALEKNWTTDQPQTRILRSVLMKPEHVTYVPHLHNTVSTWAADLIM